MKVAVFEHESWMEDHIRRQLSGHEVVFSTEPLTGDTVSHYADVEVVSVFVYSKVDAKVLDGMQSLKLIAARSTGFDHIDVQSARARNITVTNVPHYGSITVAEHTWALILSLSRKIFESYERTEKANFNLVGLRGFDLSDKTLGLVGLGEIGRHVALMSRGFNMKLRIFDSKKDEEFTKQFSNAVYVDRIEDIFTHADVISFHVPLTHDTYHVLNLENYHRLKRGCVVVNTARGGIVETKALVKALQSGVIAGAGLDVLESEALIKNQNQFDPTKLPSEQELSEAFLDHILIGLPNVIITPHNAFNSQESIIRLVDQNIANIRQFANGEIEHLDRV